MKVRTFSQLALLSTLAIAAGVGCSSAKDDGAPAGDTADIIAARNITATTDPKFQAISRVSTARFIESKDNTLLRLYELGGGDPAMNGDHLFLNAENEDEHEGGGVFDLQLNINTLTTAETTAPGTIHLVGTKDTLDDKTGNITPQPFEATVKYTTQAGGPVAARVTVTTAEGAHDIDKTTDPAEETIASVFGVVGPGKSDFDVSVYETGGGDVAMNGTRPVLSIRSFPTSDRTWDLGLNIAHITKVLTVSKFELRLEGTEDFNPSQIQSRPIAYSVKFSMSAGNKDEISDTIKLTKLPH